MKAFLYKDKNLLEAKNIEKPELKKDGAIIKVSGCGLCGSDIVKLKEGLKQTIAWFQEHETD